jgi:hypothetical protein
MADYTLSYTRLLSFAGNYTRDFTLSRSSSYSRNFAGEYSRNYTRTRESAYTRGRTSAYTGYYSSDYTRERNTDYTRERDQTFIGYYSRNFTRDRETNFTRDRVEVTSVTFDTDYFSRTLSSTAFYSRVRTSNFLRDYVAYYGGSYTRVESYTRVSTITSIGFTTTFSPFDIE